MTTSSGAIDVILVLGWLARCIQAEDYFPLNPGSFHQYRGVHYELAGLSQQYFFYFRMRRVEILGSGEPQGDTVPYSVRLITYSGSPVYRGVGTTYLWTQTMQSFDTLATFSKVESTMVTWKDVGNTVSMPPFPSQMTSGYLPNLDIAYHLLTANDTTLFNQQPPALPMNVYQFVGWWRQEPMLVAGEMRSAMQFDNLDRPLPSKTYIFSPGVGLVELHERLTEPDYDESYDEVLYAFGDLPQGRVRTPSHRRGAMQVICVGARVHAYDLRGRMVAGNSRQPGVLVQQASAPSDPGSGRVVKILR